MAIDRKKTTNKVKNDECEQMMPCLTCSLTSCVQKAPKFQSVFTRNGSLNIGLIKPKNRIRLPSIKEPSESLLV